MSPQKLKVLEDSGASHDKGESRTQKVYTYSKTTSNKPKSKEAYKIIDHCSSKILRFWETVTDWRRLWRYEVITMWDPYWLLEQKK